jgi:hypothetical protein
VSVPREPIFLARQSYHRRRLGDAAKLIPVVGAVLLVLPILSGGAARTSGGLLYIFAVWAILIVLNALVSRRLVQSIPDSEEAEAAAAPDKLED